MWLIGCVFGGLYVCERVHACVFVCWCVFVFGRLCVCVLECLGVFAWLFAYLSMRVCGCSCV